MPELLFEQENSKQVAEYNGFRFDHRSLLNCALGKPSLAFGESFSHYDGIMRSPRLPCPPYNFISRISKLNAKTGQFKGNPWLIAEYDISEDAWYFNENSSITMPYCVLMEIGLQPCGWLATFILRDDIAGKELYFRNLDGTAVQHREVKPEDNAIVTKATLTSVSKTENVIIVNFNVQCSIEQDPVFTMNTVFGFFAVEAMEEQKGLKIATEEQNNFNRLGDFNQELTSYPEKYFKKSNARLPSSKLLMLDRITGYWPKGGKAGIGFMRAEKDVKAEDWFFKAHFFQDPVQPGSLGVEALLQLIQFYMLHNNFHKDINNPVFEPVIIGVETEWHYRGQVTPDKKLIIMDMEVLEEDCHEKGGYVMAEARLWVDGLKIYHLPKIGMKLIEEPTLQKITKQYEWKMKIEENKWVLDHKPTYTIPSLPLTFEMDMMARRAIDLFPAKKIVAIDKMETSRWMTFASDSIDGKTIVKQIGNNFVEVELQLYKSAVRKESKIYERCAVGVFHFAYEYSPKKTQRIPALQDSTDTKNPYEDGSIFHGSSLQLMNNWMLGKNGATCRVDAKSLGVPIGLLHPGLLDASLHCIPHDNLNYWCTEIPRDMAAYPIRIENFSIYRKFPDTGMVDVEARFVRFDSKRFPIINIWLKNKKGILATFTLVEVLLPKGRLGTAKPIDRRDFILNKKFVPGIYLTHLGKQKSFLQFEHVKNSDWLSGTMVSIYGLDKGTPLPELTKKIALKEHASQYIFLHPFNIVINEKTGRCENLPLNDFELTVIEENQRVIVRSSKINTLSLSHYDSGHKHSGDKMVNTGDKILNAKKIQMFFEDMEKALINKFVRRVVLEEPTEFFSLKRRPILYLANHQTGVESFLFSFLIRWLGDISIKAVAKKEHKNTWMGRMDKLGRELLGEYTPVGILPFDRKNPKSFFNVLQKFKTSINNYPYFLLIHAEGTRALTAQHRVTKISSVIIDLAKECNLPIIPVRFINGLPERNNKSRLEFPFNYGKQDYYLGKAIFPEIFKEQSLKKNIDKILNSINYRGPPVEEEVPFNEEKTFRNKVLNLRDSLNISERSAVCIESLLRSPDISSETLDLLNKLISTDNRFASVGDNYATIFEIFQ